MAAGGERAIRHAFERAPVLTERLIAGGPYGSAQELLERARSLLDKLSEPERVAVLDAHPRIGASPETLSATSRREQGTDVDPTALDRLAALNEEYERRFGFRFVAFVAGRSKSEMVPVLERRLERPRDEELATSLEEFLAIARDRLART